MEEVDILPIDFSRELWIAVQFRFPRAPIIAGAPVIGQPMDIVLWDTVLPANAREFIGPAGTDQSLLQIIQRALRNISAEGLYVHLAEPPRDTIFVKMPVHSTR